MTSTKEHAFIQANGIRIHYVTAGKGPLVVLLHGFPEFWYAWRRQIPALAQHFQVVVPDLRGYGDTERPPNISDYKPSVLVKDLVGLIRGLGHEKAHIIGHDWGGAIAWGTAMEHPELIDRLVVLNCPHPVVFKRALRSNFQQIKKSWYVFFFQIPYFPELLFKMNPKRFVEKVFRENAIRKEAFSDEDLECYRRALEEPGAYEAALNYYRAAFSKSSKEDPGAKKEKIAAPTLLIWAEDDAALGKELTHEMASFFSGPFKIHYVPHCSHWVNEEQPELVNQLILQFLSEKTN